jgi:protein-S-isoprenylcysteine O-methyltransferase Ste14
MGSDTANLILLSLAWVAFAVLHSSLASLGLKRVTALHCPRLVPAYRLLYNLVAGLTLLPILWLLAYRPGPWLWRWTGVAAWVMNGLALVAAGVLMFGSAGYDLKEFLGWRQVRTGRGSAEDLEPLRISSLHRFVRHPWYSLSLVILWTRDMNTARLVSAGWITAYFIAGSWLEERKLLARFGAAYREYMARVSGLLPLPWRILSREDAQRLEGRR